MAATRGAYRTKTQTTDRRKSLQIANLKPLKRKLDRIETERIYRIIQAGFINIKQADTISWFIENNSNIFRITDVELRQLFIKHQLIANSNFPDTDAEGKHELQVSVKNILRYCSQNSIILSTYQPDTINRYSTFREPFQELCNIVLEKLLTEHEEENARWKFLLHTMEKGRCSQNAIVSLQETLKCKIMETKHMINEKDRAIRQLNNELDIMKMKAEDENNTTLNDAAKQILTNQKTLENKENKMRNILTSLRDGSYKTRVTDYAKESKLRKRKFKMAGEMYNWILKYDQDMGWRQDEIDEISALNKKELEETKELEKHFVELEKEYDAFIEERRVQAEYLTRREKEKHALTKASVKIQAIWRGFKIRKELKGKKGKKGGKGGKGGKKKK